MKASRRLFVLLSVLALAACQSPQVADWLTRSGDILFRDDFASPSTGWTRTTSPSKNGIMDYDHGTFRMLVLASNYDLWSVPGHSFRDVRVEVGATRLGGPLENRYGIICRFRDPRNFYFFVVSSDGYFAIGKVSQGARSLLGQSMMAFSPAIAGGNGQNRLRFDCIGRVLAGFVNDQEIALAQDEDHPEGDVGLLVGTFAVSGADVAFDHFIVIKP